MIALYLSFTGAEIYFRPRAESAEKDGDDDSKDSDEERRSRHVLLLHQRLSQLLLLLTAAATAGTPTATAFSTATLRPTAIYLHIQRGQQ